MTDLEAQGVFGPEYWESVDTANNALNKTSDGRECRYPLYLAPVVGRLAQNDYPAEWDDNREPDDDEANHSRPD